uniref:Cytochrome b6-f complex subunit VI n=1 Tax=Agarophyton chilense TaxID=2510777 RepID=A0A141SEK5_AGACH|nr:cytochrome b6-f complex subunit VI [Agarophyton chilense]AMK96723.1 cytochrome b6-f complex subunit VI [Agarophyton chilense]ASP44618.1 cytochrome b6-f complex subunit VI [Agarophyton chilense]UAD84348.1 cytochrome b6-f complex subunit 6 [Agarophyton chilense]
MNIFISYLLFTTAFTGLALSLYFGLQVIKLI